MADKKLLMNGLEVLDTPKFEESTAGRFCKLKVKDDKDKLTLLIFDDERQKNPFKAVEKLVSENKFGRGTFINVECVYSLYEKHLISDEAWAKISTEVKNPTLYKSPSYKVVSWEFTIPYALHERMKAKEQKEETEKNPRQMKKITDLSEFGEITP